MSPTRRQAIAATTALLAAAPHGIHAQGPTTPEVRRANLGFIALTDSAPLIIAREKGFFARHGMPDVEVNRQASWGATRDNLVLGGGRSPSTLSTGQALPAPAAAPTSVPTSKVGPLAPGQRWSVARRGWCRCSSSCPR